VSPIWTPCAICGQPKSATDHDEGCPFSVWALVKKYGSEGKAAGAVALQIEQVPAMVFMHYWPENFRSLVLFKQQTAILKLVTVAAGTSLERLQRIWEQFEDAAAAIQELNP